MELCEPQLNAISWPGAPHCYLWWNGRLFGLLYSSDIGWSPITVTCGKKTPPPTSLEDKLPEIGWYFQVECQEKCHVSCDCVRLGVMYDPSWLCAKHQIKGTGFLWDMLPIARCRQWSIDPLLAITLRRMFLRVDHCPWWRPSSNFAICEKKGRNRW